MNTAKELIQNLVQSQPEDATYDEIVRELAFDRMVQRGLEDARKRRVVGNEEMLHRIKTSPFVWTRTPSLTSRRFRTKWASLTRA